MRRRHVRTKFFSTLPVARRIGGGGIHAKLQLLGRHLRANLLRPARDAAVAARVVRCRRENEEIAAHGWSGGRPLVVRDALVRDVVDYAGRGFASVPAAAVVAHAVADVAEFGADAAAVGEDGLAYAGTGAVA